MADIFVSYVHQDRQRADEIARAMIQFGRSVWWEGRLQAGSAFVGRIDEELERAKCVLLLCSTHSLKSRWMQDHTASVRQRGVAVAVLLEDVALPSEFLSLPVVDLSTWDGDFETKEFGDLLKAVRPLVAASEFAATTEQPNPTAAASPAAPSGVANTIPQQETEASRGSSARDDLRTLFLCYRRDDTQGEAGRLQDRLIDAYGPDRVFMDIDSVPLGIDFVEHVKEQIAGCRAVIVMIGRQWVSIQDRHGNRRLDDPDDLVRIEVGTALQQKVPVIPVLVQNASMPDRADLPPDLRLLTRRNGIALRHDQWREGVARLLKELDPIMKAKR